MARLVTFWSFASLSFVQRDVRVGPGHHNFVMTVECGHDRIRDTVSGQLLDSASAEEVHAATVRLRDAALRPAPDVLSLDLWTVARLIAQGNALHWITEQFPAWRLWADKPLSDMLKIAEPWLVA